MKNLITYLKTLWSRVADSQRKEVGVISGEAHSAPIQHPLGPAGNQVENCIR